MSGSQVTWQNVSTGTITGGGVFLIIWPLLLGPSGC